MDAAVAEADVSPVEHPRDAGPLTAADLALLRRVFILNLVVLVLLRLIRDADDFSNWDLVGFLNANAFDSLAELLRRPEVHFRNPFSFPQYNVGAESTLSAILFHALGHVSLYWSNVIVVLVYDALFLFVVHRFFHLMYPDPFLETLAWLLLGMSPVTLTFAATSGFNMQAYTIVALGLLGCEYFIQGRPVVGTVLLAVAFCAVSQAYPLAFFMPYFLVFWATFRTVMGGLPVGAGRLPAPTRQRVGLAVACLLVVAAMAGFVHYASGGVYLHKISPFHPHDGPNVVNYGTLERFNLFVHQYFLPKIKVDNVAVGFAPYFMYISLLALLGLIAARGRAGGSPAAASPTVRALRGVIVVAASAGIVLLGYLPAFINLVVKSQRAIFGDIFLVVVLVYFVSRLRAKGLVGARAVLVVLGALLCVSDGYYVYVTSSVDHTRNHYPIFDFDLSDGVARHDMISAIERMKQQVNEDKAGIVVYFPRGYEENTTDPAMFFARFLRHFGRYTGRGDIAFACRWCDVRYGCPFPAVSGRPCQSTCCYNDPLPRIRSRRELAGRRLFLWWHLNQSEVRHTKLESVLRRYGRRYTIKRVAIPPGMFWWQCYELVPRVAIRRRAESVGESEQIMMTPNGTVAGMAGAGPLP